MFRIAVKTRGEPVGTQLGRKWKAMNAELARVILKAAALAGRFIRDEVQNRLNSSGRSTGTLAASFTIPRYVDSDKGIAAGALSDEKYARVQDEGTGYLPGGVIKAKPPLKCVAIPAPDVGNTDASRWPREFAEGDLILKPQKDGTGAVLIEKASDKVRFILQPSVRIEGKHYIAAAVKRTQQEVPPMVTQKLAEAMKKAAASGGGK